MVGTVVIGGGAAGVAAARALHDASEDVLLVEASERLGGRARSVRLADVDVTVDFGCGWLHSAERNPWARIAERDGFTVDRSSPHWREQWRGLGFPADDQRAFAEAYRQWSDAAHQALGGADRSLASIPADPRWRPMLEAISGYANGAPMAAVSLHDWAA